MLEYRGKPLQIRKHPQRLFADPYRRYRVTCSAASHRFRHSIPQVGWLISRYLGTTAQLFDKTLHARNRVGDGVDRVVDELRIIAKSFGILDDKGLLGEQVIQIMH